MGQLVFPGGATLGEGEGAFVIAEAGVNHNGDMELARALVDAAAEAGCDAVKFQTFRAEALVTQDAEQADYQRDNIGKSETQLEMLKRLELPFDEHRALIDYCDERDILFLSTPFDEESADFLDDLGLPAFKVPSGELTNLPFLEHLAAKGKPLLASTGMAYLSEVEQAVRTIRAETGAFALFHCVSNYPARFEDTNLRAMATLRQAFNVPVGYSDHTLGIEAPIAAVAMGAAIIEKHFTLDRTLPGPDHKASLEPGELSAMMRAIRNIERALGDGVKQPAASELAVAKVARKSIVARQDITSGTTITLDHLVCKRPGTGLAPAMLDLVVGRGANRDIKQGELLSLEVLA